MQSERALSLYSSERSSVPSRSNVENVVVPQILVVIDFYYRLAVFLARRILVIDFIQHMVNIQGGGAQYA